MSSQDQRHPQTSPASGGDDRPVRMRLYHLETSSRPHEPFRRALQVFCALALVVLAACSVPFASNGNSTSGNEPALGGVRSQPPLIEIQILADGQTLNIQAVSGSTVQQALDQAGLTLNALDRTEPPLYTVLSAGTTIRLVRVTEKFEIEQVIIPFEQQTLRNESLALDKEVLIQKGQNGLQEITYRVVLEDGASIAEQPVPVKSVVITEPRPEIRMVGVQAPFTPVAVPGKLIYLRDGNVWMIEGTTGNRRAIITTGDLDGRVLSLSADGGWLLFTRRSTLAGKINSLWVANLSGALSGAGTPVEGPPLINLSIANVIHFADWVPGSNTKVIFSTVEPRDAAPGWQANNDLNVLTFSSTGWTTRWTVILEANAGGIYGWWGTGFAWAPDALHLAYTRPDQVGLVNYKDGSVTPLKNIIPLQTRGDWAWVPGIAWGPDGKILYTLDHVVPTGGGGAGSESSVANAAEQSPLFDLAAVMIETATEQPAGERPAATAFPLVSQTGMFGYPLASPLQTGALGEIDYRLVFLQAIFPTQSETSRYRLVVMDRDGSNRKVLFPEQGSPGLEPQQAWGAWSPAPLPETGNFSLAVIYQGNLWFVDAVTGAAVQVTSDGLTTRIIWK